MRDSEYWMEAGEKQFVISTAVITALGLGLLFSLSLRYSFVMTANFLLIFTLGGIGLSFVIGHFLPWVKICLSPLYILLVALSIHFLYLLGEGWIFIVIMAAYAFAFFTMMYQLEDEFPTGLLGGICLTAEVLVVIHAFKFLANPALYCAQDLFFL